jgi:hypothetical protein
MGKAAVSFAAAVLALGVLCEPGASKAQPYGYPPERVAWMVGPGFFGFSGYPWPAPPLALRARLQNAWRQVEVCS